MKECYLVWIEAVFLVSILIALGQCIINLAFFRHRDGRTTAPSEEKEEEAGKASVLIPARNEEANISTCLESLVSQKEGISEILVLDDQSDDNTAEVVRKFAAQDSRVRLLGGRERPEGWIGKNWACHQLAEAAVSENLLFTDADTVHEPGSVIRALAIQGQSRADLLSLWPRQITVSWAEHLLIPMMEMLLLIFLPHWMPGKFSTLGAACGQFIILRREAYERMGGHQAVQHHLVEDVALARRARGMGLKVVNRDGSRILRCRMYQSWAEIKLGFSKNLRASCDDSLLTFFGLYGFHQFLYTLPFLQIPLLPWMSPEMRWLWLLQVVAVYLTRIVLAIARGHHWLGVLAHPVAQVLWLYITLYSWFVTAKGQVLWKGRQYGANIRNPESSIRR
jgi:chlorobactene glucosyltransferase